RYATHPHLRSFPTRRSSDLSRRFVEFATGLARHWVEKYDLDGGTAVEIGCGKGEFLEYLVEAGMGRVVGIDPGLHPERLRPELADRKSTRLNSSHVKISYAV